MIYMVELDIEDEKIVPIFFDWWTEHVGYMLGVPGFDTAQRFSMVYPAVRRSYVQLYSIVDADVMSSEAYRSIAGPQSSGMGHAFSNWHRNVFAGAPAAPVIQPDQYLVVIDNSMPSQWPQSSDIIWMDTVGLDRSVSSRGIATTKSRDHWSRAGIGSVRIFKPTSGLLTKAEHAKYRRPPQDLN